jgi:hypothetical protein
MVVKLSSTTIVLHAAFTVPVFLCRFPWDLQNKISEAYLAAYNYPYSWDIISIHQSRGTFNAIKMASLGMNRCSNAWPLSEGDSHVKMASMMFDTHLPQSVLAYFLLINLEITIWRYLIFCNTFTPCKQKCNSTTAVPRLFYPRLLRALRISPVFFKRIAGCRFTPIIAHAQSRHKTLPTRGPRHSVLYSLLFLVNPYREYRGMKARALIRKAAINFNGRKVTG